MFFSKSFFTAEQNSALVKAISHAENFTSGEIRVHIEARCKTENVLDRTMEVFYKLKMNETAQQNGVLIYIAYDDHRFAIVGDKGINAVVPANFWDGTKEVMREHFKRSEFFEGIEFAITEVGFHLKQYFPLQAGDKNELTNEISEG